MNFQEAVNRACEEPSLSKALTWVAIWECERAVKQALECERTGISTAGTAHEGGKWDTCFEVLFKGVLAQWEGSPAEVITPADIFNLMQRGLR